MKRNFHLLILACKMNKTKPTTQVLPTVGTGGNQGGPLKPVGFVNHGSIAATVMAWTYKPLGSDSPGIPSNASTVSFPPTAPGLWPNSSRFLLLPLGTYTWCYYWELGDVNNDGMMEYAHAIDTRPVVLDEADSDDLDSAEQVDISAPPGTDELDGMCGAGLDIARYIVASSHIDRFYYGGSTVGLAHNTDFVTLRGPITVEYFFKHRANDSDPWIDDPRVTVTIPAGETQQFYLEDTIGEHLGNWDLFVQLISINSP
jgi:hypothetical protein